MEIMKFLSEFEITLSGGFAVYGILCMMFVFYVGFTSVLGWIIKYMP